MVAKILHFTFYMQCVFSNHAQGGTKGAVRTDTSTTRLSEVQFIFVDFYQKSFFLRIFAN